MAMAFNRGGLAELGPVVERAVMTSKRRGLPRLESLTHALHARFAAGIGEVTVASRALDKVQPAFSPARWTHDPFWWRSDFAAGSAIAMLQLARGELPAAEQTLNALQEACATQRRVRQLGAVRALQCAVKFRAGRPEDAARALAAVLEERLAEDDLQPFVDLGPMLVPAAQFARKWALDNGVSTLARRALGALADRGAEVRVPDAQSRLLSPRELEVLIELARGAPNKMIARALQMTENTVKFHLKNIFHKLGVQHRAAAIRAGRDQGLLS
jgi:LuxR family maltose regulon positive regulatory protein